MGIPTVTQHAATADGTDQTIITGIDDDARVVVLFEDDDGDKVQVASDIVTDNELRLTYDTPGQYEVRVDAIDDTDPQNIVPLTYWMCTDDVT
jgi:hypothetical protein